MVQYWPADSSFFSQSVFLLSGVHLSVQRLPARATKNVDVCFDNSVIWEI